MMINDYIDVSDEVLKIPDGITLEIDPLSVLIEEGELEE